MRRAVTSGCLSAVLMFGAAACGGDAPPGPPKPQWKASPGQAAKLTDELERREYTCTTQAAKGFTFTACAKSVRHTAGETELAAVKFTSAKDGTIVYAAINNAAGSEPFSGIVGDKDATILEAGGENLDWGLPNRDAGPLTLVITGLEGVPEPIAPPPYQTKEQLLPSLDASEELGCALEEEPLPDAPMGKSSWDDIPRLWCEYGKSYEEEHVTARLADPGSGVTMIELSTFSSYREAYTGDPAALSDENAFAATRKLFVKHSEAIWTALKGGKPDQIRRWVESHLAVNTTTLGYVDGRLVEIRSSRSPESGGHYEITVTVSPEAQDLLAGM